MKVCIKISLVFKGIVKLANAYIQEFDTTQHVHEGRQQYGNLKEENSVYIVSFNGDQLLTTIRNIIGKIF